jgi:hypothetical protein
VDSKKLTPQKTEKMKKTFLFGLLAATTAFGTNAQNVNIPDANFKTYLTQNSAINTNADAEIQLSEAQAFTGSIQCNSRFIADLTGIEAFTSLTVLHCAFNQLTTLDLTSNLALVELQCQGNQLTGLNVSTNTALDILYCQDNQLTSIDVSANTVLRLFFCENNDLTSIDVSTNTVLTHLYCDNNDLTSIDVSNNLLLEKLQAGGNQLTNLDVSTNLALEQLTCFENQLTSLDLSPNILLTELECYSNLLTSLNVANGSNEDFEYLDATDNPDLSCIEVDNAAYSTANWIGGDFSIDPGVGYGENCGSITGINEASSTIIEVYPNPTNGLVHFSAPTNVQLTNAMGQTVAHRKNVTALDLYDLPKGMYLVTHTDNNGKLVQQSRIVRD